MKERYSLECVCGNEGPQLWWTAAEDTELATAESALVVALMSARKFYGPKTIHPWEIWHQAECSLQRFAVAVGRSFQRAAQ